MSLYILFGFIMSVYLFVRIKYRKVYKLSRLLNNDILTLPILGHLYNVNFLKYCYRMKTLICFGRKALKNGGVAALWLGTKLFTIVADPIIADNLTKTCLEKDEITNIAQSLIGNGSIFAPVSVWRPRRKAVASNFSLLRLNNFVDIFSEQSLIMVNKLKSSKEKDAVAIFKYLTSYSMDSVCESTLGVKVYAQCDSEHPFASAFEENCRVFVKMIFEPYIYATPIFKLLPSHTEFMRNNRLMRVFVKEIINIRRQDLQNNIKNETFSEQDVEYRPPKTFLDMMITTLDSEQGFSDMELLEESLVLILAGTDTSATGAAFIAMMLARHPGVQGKVYKELHEVFGDSERPVTAKDLTQLKYLGCVVKESIRLYPPVPVTIRKLVKDVTIPSGITLVKDSSILIHNWALNRNPEYWGEDANEFRPERFIDAPPKHPAAFASFSVGPRSCIGYKYALMSMTTATANLVRNFKLLPEDPDLHSDLIRSKCLEKETPLRVKFEIMMRDVDDFKLRFEPRIKT